MLQIVGSVVTGTPAVSPPGDLERYKNASGSTIEAGVAVQLSGGTGNEGELDLASADGSDVFGITLEEIENDDYGRIQILAPGMIVKGLADAEADIGNTVGLNDSSDGFDNGDNSAFLVIKVGEDEDGDLKLVWAVPVGGALAVV